MILNWLLKKFPKSSPTPKDKPVNTPQPAATTTPAKAPKAQPSETPDSFITQKTKLLEKCMEVVRERFPEEPKYYVTCSYPGTNNTAYLFVEPDAKDPALRRLSTRVVRKGTDLCVMHYIFKGTVEELTAYLSDSTHVPELLDSWQQLSDSVDKKN